MTEEDVYNALVSGNPKLAEPQSDWRSRARPVTVAQTAQPEQKPSSVNAGGAGKAFAYGFNRLIPFGNEISTQLAATAVAPFVPETRQQLVDQARQHTTQTMEAHPWASGVGTAAGVLATLPAISAKAITGAASTTGVRGAVNAIPKGLSAVDRFVRGGKVAKDAGVLAKTGNLALQSAKSAAVAAPSAGLYAAGEAEPGQRGEAFKSGAGVGAAVGAALPVAGAALGAAAIGTGRIYKGLKARDAEALEAAGQAIKQRSSRAYQAMRDSGAAFKPGATNQIIQNMQKELANDGVLNSKLHKKVIDLFEDFKQEALDQNITLEGLDQWRQLFGQVAGEFTDKVNARKALLLKNALDDAINDLPEDAFSVGGPEALQALRTARTEWARQSKFNQIADIIEGSTGDANKLKRDLERFRLNPKKTSGWSKEELAALKNATNQTTGEGVMKLVGKFGFDLGSGRAVGNTALPVLGGIGTGLAAGSIGPGMVIPAVGTAARVGQKMLARGKAEELLQVIEQGGNVSMDMVNALPPAEKNKLLSRIMQMSPSRAAMVGKVKQYIKDESGSVGRIDTPEFKKWFGDSKVVDADGKPLVVYHGTPVDTSGDFAFDTKKIGQRGTALGHGFYLTTDKQTASGYVGRDGGSLVEAYLSMHNPLDLGAPAFNVSQLKKVIKRAVEIEAKENPSEIQNYKDSFLSNFVDTYSLSESRAIDLVAQQLFDGNKKAVDQISEISNVVGNKTTAPKAVRDTLGFDGIKSEGYQNKGGDGSGGTIYVAWFPEQIKSVHNKGTWNPADPRIQMGAAGVAGGTALMSGNGSSKPK